MRTLAVFFIVLMLALLVVSGCSNVQEEKSPKIKSVAGIHVDNAGLEQSLEYLTTLEALEREDVKDW